MSFLLQKIPSQKKEITKSFLMTLQWMKKNQRNKRKQKIWRAKSTQVPDSPVWVGRSSEANYESNRKMIRIDITCNIINTLLCFSKMWIDIWDSFRIKVNDISIEVMGPLRRLIHLSVCAAGLFIWVGNFFFVAGTRLNNSLCVSSFLSVSPSYSNTPKRNDRLTKREVSK